MSPDGFYGFLPEKMNHRWILGVSLALFPVLGKRGGEAAVPFVATEERDSAAIPGEGKSVQKAEPEEGNGGTRANARPGVKSTADNITHVPPAGLHGAIVFSSTSRQSLLRKGLGKRPTAAPARPRAAFRTNSLYPGIQNRAPSERCTKLRQMPFEVSTTPGFPAGCASRVI